MDCIRSFLESSTIHGLAYISTTKNYVRLFWTIVILTGFSTAGVLIHQSFKDWNENPVTTTIETRPISEITFPKVTVCPPKNTLTDLNYYLMKTKNMTLNNNTKDEFTNYALELLYDHVYDSITANLSLLEDKDRYYNWYHGYTQITLPYYFCWNPDMFGACDGVTYKIRTHATSGTISSKHFGESFDPFNMERHGYFRIDVYPPDNVKSFSNVTLHYDIRQISMKDLTSGQDKLYWKGNKHIDKVHTVENFTPPEDSYIYLLRQISNADLMQQKMSQMPGFKFSWYYSGMAVTAEPKFSDSDITKAFVRNSHC